MGLTAESIKREQRRQARFIHGGWWQMFVALLGVKLARLPLPGGKLRASVYRSIFSNKYPPGVNEEEAEHPLESYRSLNAFFTRGIKPEFRPIAQGATRFLCPCDGRVLDLGRLERDKLLTVKGIEYTLSSLLPGVDTQPFEDGHYAIIFLSPIDCHRIFSPQDGALQEAIHVPGHRLPVHPPCQRPEYPVYALNERMIFRLSTPLGACIVVMIAGWGVGNISLPFALEFRPRRNEVGRKMWSPGRGVSRGEWIATFELGSTVVLITPPHNVANALINKEQKVKYGQPAFDYPG
jgi:phosphatidylserine decarboxylase